MGAIKDNFVRVKHRPHRGYSRHSKLPQIIHLYQTYAIISNVDWVVNYKRFREVYTPTDPIEVLWHQIYYAIAYSDAGSTP